MLRAMDSAVAGLRSHQNKFDVSGNNIANVNTFGYKAQSYSFKDAMYQTSVASSGGKNTDGTATIGGNNASQYGYGSMTGSIATDFTSSTPTYVGGFNASINGSGFFITNSANTSAGIAIDSTNSSEATKSMKTNNFSYTRVGQFTVDANGYIVDANGNFVYGYRPNALVDPTAYGSDSADSTTRTLFALRAPSENATTNGPANDTTFTGKAMQLKSVEIGNDGVIKAVANVPDEETYNSASTTTYPTTIPTGTNYVESTEEDIKTGKNPIYSIASDGTVTITDKNGSTTTVTTVKNPGNPPTTTKYVDVTDASVETEEVANIPITDSDAKTVDLTFQTGAACSPAGQYDGYTVTVNDTGVVTLSKVTGDTTEYITYKASEANVDRANHKVTIPANEKPTSKTTVTKGTLGSTGTYVEGTHGNEKTSIADDGTIVVKTMDADGNTVSTKTFKVSDKISKKKELTTTTSAEASVTKTTVASKTEAVTRSKSIILGKIAIASFQNQEGLQKAGNNTFNASTGDNTGEVTASLPGEGATPSLMAGYLEASNVDLAKEFSDMITTQRGFQANAKIITVSDEILQELVNMKR